MNELSHSGGYYCVYGVQSLDDKGGKVKSLGTRGDCCFGSFTNYKGRQKFEIYMYKGLEKSIEDKNHLCLFSTGEILDHIEALNLVLEKGEFVFENMEEQEDKYILNFIIDSEYRIVYSFILTWIRYLWEKPYILATIESFNLKDLFPEMDPFTRFNLARATLPERLYWGLGHSATKNPGKLFTPDELKTILHSGTTTLLNNIYPALKNRNSLSRYSITSKKYNGDNDIEFWRDKEEFKKRIDCYIKNKELYEKET